MVQRRKVLPAGLLITLLTMLVSCASVAQPAPPEADPGAPGGTARPIVGSDVGAGWNILSIHWSAFALSGANYLLQTGYIMSEGLWPHGSLSGYASVQLPTGAAIGQIGLFAYDVETGLDVRASLSRYTGYGSVAGCSPCGPPVPPAQETIAFVSSAGAPGYRYYRSNVTPLHVVDNYVHRGGGQYVVWVEVMPYNDFTLGFRGVEIWWTRQISPAPGVASFVDVPTTHQFFREIEALKEAGITLGCTATEFCPNASLTRAQMAAFLARALGLYWQF